jgi:hypothetical protein
LHSPTTELVWQKVIVALKRLKNVYVNICYFKFHEKNGMYWLCVQNRKIWPGIFPFQPQSDAKRNIANPTQQQQQKSTSTNKVRFRLQIPTQE